MVGEIDKLREHAEKVAKLFVKRYPEFAQTFTADAEAFKARADVARSIGVPESFSDSEVPAQQAVTAEPISYAIEIPAVSEELYNRTREAVEATGYNFVAAIRSVSMEALIAEDVRREQERIGYVNPSKTMRSTVPPEMEVAINPVRFMIEGSNRLATDAQKKIIKEKEVEWMEKLPEDLRPFVSMRMVDPSTLSQLEDAYMDATGKLLFPDFFARTDVQDVRGYVAFVGRSDPSFGRGVNFWRRDRSDVFVFAVFVVVLPRKLTS